MNPIPRDARPGDLRWEREFIELAHGLVTAGAKIKLIVRLTEFPVRKIRSLYLTLRGFAAPSGPVMQGKAHFFTMRSARTSAAWSIQCAIFLACYKRISVITERRLHRGWHLLAAFNGYLSLTEPLKKSVKIKRLDINQAYGLLTHCGFLEEPTAELQRRECPTCLIVYPIVTSLPLRSQPCPVCTMNGNLRRLAGLRSSSKRRRARKHV